MTTDPDQIRLQIDSLLAELPDTSVEGSGLGGMEIDEVARRLEEAHDVLVQALESVEKG
jgi:DNA-binding transcriptional ArsR family regulator